MNIIQNLVSFKIGWVACVMFAAAGMPLLSLASVATVLVLHLLTVPAPAKEALLVVCAMAIGLAWESGLVALGLVSYTGHSGAWWAPMWIVAMWALFATTINHGLAWVKKYWVYAVLAGAIGGPMAFYGGAGLGAVSFTNTPLSLAIIGIGWALMLPLLALVAETIIDSSMLEPGVRKHRGMPAVRLAAQVQSLVNRGDAIR